MNLTLNSDHFLTLIERIGWMFYLVDPQKTTFNTIEEVPNYLHLSLPIIGVMILVEQTCRFVSGRKLLPYNDTIINLGFGLFILLLKAFYHGVSIIIYTWIYDNFGILQLSCESIFTWFLCWLLIELGYYWWHRCDHEINFLWSAHQVHHSSEYYQISNGVRVSFIEQTFLISGLSIFAIIGIPPPIFIIHYYFTNLYQIWLHTELIPKLGPLEYIINTPSHHRVHHGRNRKYIDKNYGGTLILWDRLFGTFAAEDEDDGAVYGLTKPVQSFDFFTLQMGYYWNLAKRFWLQDEWKNKILLVLYGPGWEPGKPRLGCIHDIPDVNTKMHIEKYHVKIAVWKIIYISLHSLSIYSGLYLLLFDKQFLSSYGKILLVIVFFVLTLISFGALLDNKYYASLLEMGRCLIYFPIDYIIIGHMKLIPHWFVDVLQFNFPTFEQLLNTFEQLIVDSSILSNRILFSFSLILWMAIFVYKYFINLPKQVFNLL